MIPVLVTNAQGYLGRHVVNELRNQGHEVIARDALPQDPAGLTNLEDALRHVQAVVHLVDPLHPLDRDTERPAEGLDPLHTLLRAMCAAGVGRLVLQSSLGIYGEGRYIDGDGRAHPVWRTQADLKAGEWEARGLRNQPLAPMPTPEDAPPAPLSPAARLCHLRERLARRWARVAGAEIAVLRMGRLFGPPAESGAGFCGGVGMMVASILAGKPPLLMEDGGQTEDWLHVRDAARAVRLALVNCDRRMPPLNISTGKGHTAREVAQLAGMAAFDYGLTAREVQLACPGTSRHLVGCPGAAAERIGFTAETRLSNGLGEMVHWVKTNGIPAHDRILLRKLQETGQLVGPGRAEAAHA